MSRLGNEDMKYIKLLLILGAAGIFAVNAAPGTEKISGNRRAAIRPLESRAYNHPGGRVPPHEPYQPDYGSNETTTPWANDSDCDHYQVHLGLNLIQTYLVSYPRSGSSWLRYLIEGATGFFTCSVYADERLYDLGYHGELQPPNNYSCILCKDHQWRPRVFNDTHPCLLLLRNPRAVLLSFYAFRNSPTAEDSFDFTAPAELFRTDFHSKVLARIELWERIATILIRKCKYLFVLYYEFLKEFPRREIRRILGFLRVPIDEPRLDCLHNHQQGYVDRGQPEYDNIYTPEEEEWFNQAVARVSALLVSKGWEPLPYLAPLPSK